MSLRTFGRALLRRKYLLGTDVTNTKLDRCLSTLDLTLLGVGSTLGLGIYVIAGQVASVKAGPSVAISFLVAAFASIFAALCYAEFGARVPKAGSAYVYSYVTVGELMAFIIGWNLILEYVIGTASVARGYSGYLDYLLNGAIKHTLTKYIPMNLPGLSAYPDFLALTITLLLTVLLSIGVKESARFNNIFTGLNLLIVIYAVTTGLFKANIHNWQLPPEKIPKDFGDGGYFPYGFSGMMQGAAMCFYAYIGFDCIATTGEEVRNPQKAIPIGIILSLLIVFLAYFGVSVVQTLMWPYYDQYQEAPLPYVFERVGWTSAKWIIAIGGLAGLSTSLLGSMFPLPRVLSAMATDGLIFRFLAEVHSRFKTPFLATIIAGSFAAVMAMIFDVHELASMMSIGTLLAYTLVAISVLLLRYRILDEQIHLTPLSNVHSPTPSVPEMQNSSIMAETNHTDLCADGMDPRSGPFANNANVNSQTRSVTTSLSTMLASTRHYTGTEILRMVANLDNIDVQTSFSSMISTSIIGAITFLIVILNLVLILLEDLLFKLNIPALCAVSVMVVLVAIATILLYRQPSDRKELLFRVPCVPFIPLLSVFVNIYLMMKLSSNTWIRFGVWMFIGFLIYFGYGMKHSSENNQYIAATIQCTYESISETQEPDNRKSEHEPLLCKS